MILSNYNKRVGIMDKTHRPLWQLLLLTSDSKKFTDLSCEECFSLLEYDARLLATGATPDELHPSISHHLALCAKCQVKFDSWIKTLEEDVESSV